jgi:hypothetical protein
MKPIPPPYVNTNPFYSFPKANTKVRVTINNHPFQTPLFLKREELNKIDLRLSDTTYHVLNSEMYFAPENNVIEPWQGINDNRCGVSKNNLNVGDSVRIDVEILKGKKKFQAASIIVIIK